MNLEKIMTIQSHHDLGRLHTTVYEEPYARPAHYLSCKRFRTDSIVICEVSLILDMSGKVDAGVARFGPYLLRSGGPALGAAGLVPFAFCCRITSGA